MADELIIESVKLRPETGDWETLASEVQADLIVTGEFTTVSGRSPGDQPSLITELAEHLESAFARCQDAAFEVIPGLIVDEILGLHPEFEAAEVTIRCSLPNIKGQSVQAICARRRKQRPAHEVRQRRKAVKPFPRPR